MLGVDGGFACRTKRNLVTGHVIDEVKPDQSPVSGHRPLEIGRRNQRARGLKLASRNRIVYEADLGLEDATRYGFEQNFRLIAHINALQGVLLERRYQSPIRLAVVDENHGWTEGRRDHINARPQCQLGNKAACRGSNNGLVQIVLSIGKLIA